MPRSALEARPSYEKALRRRQARLSPQSRKCVQQHRRALQQPQVWLHTMQRLLHLRRLIQPISVPLFARAHAPKPEVVTLALPSHHKSSPSVSTVDYTVCTHRCVAVEVREAQARLLRRPTQMSALRPYSGRSQEYRANPKAVADRTAAHRNIERMFKLVCSAYP